LASLVASKNEILIEDVLQVVEKVIKKHDNQCQVKQEKKQKKNTGRKACLCIGGGVSNCRGR